MCMIASPSAVSGKAPDMSPPPSPAAPPINQAKPPVQIGRPTGLAAGAVANPSMQAPVYGSPSMAQQAQSATKDSTKIVK
jgi:hypothetical protein